MNRHDTIGIDLVAMCANDIVAHGATPLFFLDYLAVAQLSPEIATLIIDGITQGCKPGPLLPDRRRDRRDARHLSARRL